jgi:Domain of unknown function (DUF6468)
MSIALDVVVALLLVAALGGGVVLNHRIQALRGTREDLARLVAEFDRGLVQARSGMEALKAASADAHAQLGERIVEARRLVDELVFLAQAADRTADRLAGRPSMGPAPPKPAARDDMAPRAATAGQGRTSESERALLHALRGVR